MNGANINDATMNYAKTWMAKLPKPNSHIATKCDKG